MRKTESLSTWREFQSLLWFWSPSPRFSASYSTRLDTTSCTMSWKCWSFLATKIQLQSCRGSFMKQNYKNRLSARAPLLNSWQTSFIALIMAPHSIVNERCKREPEFLDDLPKKKEKMRNSKLENPAAKRQICFVFKDSQGFFPFLSAIPDWRTFSTLRLGKELTTEFSCTVLFALAFPAPTTSVHRSRFWRLHSKTKREIWARTMYRNYPANCGER